MTHRLTGKVEWRPGPVGDAVAASLDARLRRFVRDEESEPVVLFSPEARAVSDAGDWYGEHLGKWLVAASHAHRRTGDEALGESIRRVVEAIVASQEPDGYLGTYAPGAPCRMTDPKAESVRTWDLWVHAWTILGLLAVSPSPSGSSWRGGRGERRESLETLATQAAVRIGDLLLDAFQARSPLDQGNHEGLSGGVIVHPLAELALATGDPRYAVLARRVVDELEAKTGLLTRDDVAEIGTGKAYQILWSLVGLVALHRATGETGLLETVERLWQNVHDHHLTPLGGPWGGLQGHKETFAPQSAFSPYGMVETCSAATWMALSRDLFALTGEARCVEAFERTLLNALLGALDENGADWVYFSFPNGRRNNAYHWACCKSSGAMALEEASDMVATATNDAIYLNLLLAARVEIEGCVVDVETEGEDATIRYEGDRPLIVRRGDGLLTIMPPNTTETFRIDTPIRVVSFTHTVEHHGQEIVRQDYAYVTRGPYVYATGLIDGYRREETLRLARLTPEAPFRPKSEGIDFHQPGRDPIPFFPYYRAGGRHEGAWRTTWLGIAWQ